MSVHDWGARVTIVLAFVSLVIAAVRLRSRRDLLVGTGILFLALLLEAYLGGGIGDHPSWPSFHIPLGLLLVALSVWLPFRVSKR